MNATLEYNLPEEESDFRAALNGPNYRCAVWRFDQKIRGEMKHKNLSLETYKAFEYCREELRKTLEEDNILIEP